MIVLAQGQYLSIVAVLSRLSHTLSIRDPITNSPPWPIQRVPAYSEIWMVNCTNIVIVNRMNVTVTLSDSENPVKNMVECSDFNVLTLWGWHCSDWPQGVIGWYSSCAYTTFTSLINARVRVSTYLFSLIYVQVFMSSSFFATRRIEVHQPWWAQMGSFYMLLSKDQAHCSFCDNYVLE